MVAVDLAKVQIVHRVPEQTSWQPQVDHYADFAKQINELNISAKTRQP